MKRKTCPEGGCKDCPPHNCLKDAEEPLAELKAWCNAHQNDEGMHYRTNKAYDYFETALFIAQKDYIIHKSRAWDRWLPYVFTGIKAVALAAISSIAVVLSSVIDKVDNLEAVYEAVKPRQSWILIAALTVLLVGTIASVLNDWDARRENRETWARHSARYNRLILALWDFHISKQKPEDFNRFMDIVRGILERNYDQFELNISKNGLAKHTRCQKENDG